MSATKKGRPNGMDKLIHKPRGRHAPKNPGNVGLCNNVESVVGETFAELSTEENPSYILENDIFSPGQFVDNIRIAMSDKFISEIVKHDLTSDDIFCILGFYVNRINTKSDELNKMTVELEHLKAKLLSLGQLKDRVFRSSDINNNPTWN